MTWLSFLFWFDNIFGLIFDLVVFLSDLWFGTHPPQRYSGRSEEWACDQQLFEDLFRSWPHHLHSHHFHHNHDHHLQTIIFITITVTIIIDVTTIPLTITLGSVLKAECEGELGLVFKEFICKRVPPGNEIINGVTLDQSIGDVQFERRSKILQKSYYTEGSSLKSCERKDSSRKTYQRLSLSSVLCCSRLFISKIL